MEDLNRPHIKNLVFQSRHCNSPRIPPFCTTLVSLTVTVAKHKTKDTPKSNRLYNLTKVLSLEFPPSCIWPAKALADLRGGARNTSPPGSEFFHFHTYPLWELAPHSGKSWIRHCKGISTKRVLTLKFGFSCYLHTQYEFFIYYLKCQMSLLSRNAQK